MMPARDPRDDVDAFAARDREPTVSGKRRRGAKRMNMVEALEDLRRITKLPRYPTPFPTLNHSLGLGGHVGGQVIVVAGGTGMGKTTLLLTLAQDYAVHHGPVLFVTLEMRAGHCVARASAPALRVSANQLLYGELEVDVHNVPLSSNIEFIEKCSLAELRESVEDMKKEYGKAPLVIIDYLQKLVAQAMVGDARPDPRLATAATSAVILGIARELEVPIVVASATGRGSAAKLRGTQRGGRRGDPRELPPGELVDVSREASDVEYDAAALLALHVSDETDIDGHQVATLTVAKSRFGRSCHIAMGYDGAGAIWIDKGQVERKKKVEEDPEKLTAERIELLNKIAIDALEWLARSPLSLEGLRKQMRRSRTDIELAIAPHLRDGTIVKIGSGPKQKLALAATGTLPGMGGGT